MSDDVNLPFRDPLFQAQAGRVRLRQGDVDSAVAGAVDEEDLTCQPKDDHTIHYGIHS